MKKKQYAPAPSTQAERTSESPDDGRLVHDGDETPLEWIDSALFDPSPMNPAGRMGKDAPDRADMVASVRQVGVLQPLLVRPSPKGEGRFEVVFGHRRLDAALEVGLPRVPAIVRRLSDLQVLEAQLIENLQRSGVHELVEAEGYEQLVQRHGKSPDDVAAMVGKSKSYVYQRLKLCSLAKPVRAKFLAGELDASQALLVARVVGEKRQGEAWKVLVDRHLPFRDAAALVRQQFLLELSQATFDPADAGLVPAAGDCALCPKRVGNQVLLFPDVKNGDVCTDAACYARKVEAAFERRAREHRAAGHKVLAAAAATKLYPRWSNGDLEHSARRTWVDADAADPSGELGRRPLRKALAGKLPAGAVLARDHEGRAHVLVDRTEAKKALRAAGVELPKREVSQRSVSNAIERKRRQKAAAEQDALRLGAAAVLERVMAAARASGTVESQLRPVLLELLIDSEPDAIASFADARPDFPPSPRSKTRYGMGFARNSEKGMRTYLAGLDDGEQAAAVLELALRVSLVNHWGEIGQPLKGAAERLGIDPKKVAIETGKTIKAAADAAKKAARPSGKPKASSKSRRASPEPGGRCWACGCTEAMACEGGCGWADEERTLCDRCAG